MKFDQWKKLAVSTSDLRTVDGIEDSLRDVLTPVPGIAFLKPVYEDFRGHQTIKCFDCLGWIIFDQKRGMWDVQIENTEREFAMSDDAIRCLWDMHYKDQLDVTPFRLIAVDREGEIVLNVRCHSEDAMFERVRNELPQYDTVEEMDFAYNEAVNDLSRVGARFHEFVGGHFAAFPIDD